MRRVDSKKAILNQIINYLGNCSDYARLRQLYITFERTLTTA